MSCPLLFVHAGLDEYITVEHADRLREAMESGGKAGEVRSYAEAQHAFFNDTQPDVYNEDAARDAWERTRKFFRKHLVG
jgi:carboxymethylenebutenolidase